MRFNVVRSVTFVLINLLFCLPCLAAISLDPTFSTMGGGRLTIAFPDSTSNYSAHAFRVFVQPSGRIVVGGTFTNAAPDGQLSGVAMVGITTTGTLDTAFGPGGFVTDWRPDAMTSFRDALMYTDGTTLRLSQVLRLPAGARTVRAVRLGPDGAVDSAFESNASVGSNTGFSTARPQQVAVRSDGKVLMLIIDGEESQYFLYRLNGDGTRDTTFGSNGVIGITFNKLEAPFNATMTQMFALGDGKVVIAGHGFETSSNGSESFFLTRLTESGNRDKTFNQLGFARIQFGPGLVGRVKNAILQPDGKMLLCGSVSDSDTDVWMMRFQPNGRPDNTFGIGGMVRHDFAPGDFDVANSITVSPDGKIRIAGQLGQTAIPRFLVARFSATGVLEDQTSIAFNTGLPAVANDITLQPDGKLLVAGYAKNPNASLTGNVMAIARFTE